MLAGWTGPEVEINALFPRGRVTSPKVRAFIDFLVERFSVDVDYMQAMCPNARPPQAREARVSKPAPAIVPDPAELAVA